MLVATPLPWPGTTGVQVDLRNVADTAAMLDRVQPTVIAHFAAATNVERCEQDPAEAEDLTVGPTVRLARYAAASGARFLLMSTDSVFDGERGGYLETDRPNPVNHYARCKLLSEEAVRAAGPNHLIVRANIFGWNAQPKFSLAEWVLQLLETGAAVPGFTDVVFTPLLVNTLSELMVTLLDRGAKGTIHVASADALSKYDFAMALAATFNLPIHKISRATLASSNMKARRPLNTALKSGRLAGELGITSPVVQRELERFRALRECGFSARLKAACSLSL
jgi:dTDP-4-dehydrorhamnose reductase